MRKDLEDWERESYISNERTIHRSSPEIELHVHLREPAIEKQRLIEELFIDCFNKAQEIIEDESTETTDPLVLWARHQKAIDGNAQEAQE